jgi:DivIVA domain-containing protein
MVDESFHLTPVDVRRFDFGSALRGYDKARVEQFRAQVIEELERITRVNMELESKARGFHEQLKAFRDRDKALNEALVSAQQIRAETREQAEREAQLILREARADAEKVAEETRAEIRRLQATIENLERMRRAHVAQLRALVQRHLMEIDASEQMVASWPDPGTGRLDPGPAPSSPSSTSAAPAAATPASAPESAAAATPAAPEAKSAAKKAPTPSWLDASVPE